MSLPALLCGLLDHGHRQTTNGIDNDPVAGPTGTQSGECGRGIKNTAQRAGGEESNCLLRVISQICCS
jgi:hypothetical protein